MILTRKIAAWTMTATAGLLFVAPSAAHADWNDCPANSFCLWEHPEATGRMVVVGQGSSGIPDLRAVNFDDITTSAANTTDGYACLFEHPDYQGGYVRLDPHAFQPLAGATDDTASSARWC